jgi:predicted small metal-binding protein
MARKYECRDSPTAINCTLSIHGGEEEVLDVAVHHATTVHGHTNAPQLREQIRSLLKDEPETRAAGA